MCSHEGDCADEAAERIAEIDGVGRFQIGKRQHCFVTFAAFEEVAPQAAAAARKDIG